MYRAMLADEATTKVADACVRINVSMKIVSRASRDRLAQPALRFSILSWVYFIRGVYCAQYMRVHDTCV